MHEQLSLLDLVAPAAIIRPVDPDGHVVQGEPDEEIAWSGRGVKTLLQIHQHTDGLWMWSVSFETSETGVHYRVGPKWGRFATTRRDAVTLAMQELRERVDESQQIAPAQKTALISWAARMEAQA